MAEEDATVGIIFTQAMPKKSNGLVEEREDGRINLFGIPYFKNINCKH